MLRVDRTFQAILNRKSRVSVSRGAGGSAWRSSLCVMSYVGSRVRLIALKSNVLYKLYFVSRVFVAPASSVSVRS